MKTIMKISSGLILILFILGCGIGTKSNNLKSGGPAYKVGIGNFALAIDASANVWILSGHLLKISSEGLLLGTYDSYAGTNDIAIDSVGNVWMVVGGSTIVKFDPTADQYSAYPVTNATYGEAIAIDRQGDILVTGYTESCTTSGAITSCTSTNGIITKLTSNGVTLATYHVGNNVPSAIAIDASDNIWIAGPVYSCSFSSTASGTITEAVIELNPSGITMGTYIVGSYPCNGNNYIILTNQGRVINLAVDPSGNVWVASRMTETVTKLSSTGVTLGTYNAGGGTHWGLGIDADGNIWVTNYYTNGGAITEIDPNGTELKDYSAFTIPQGIAIDAFGNVWTTYGGGVIKNIDVAKGPQYFPYTGPQWP